MNKSDRIRELKRKIKNLQEKLSQAIEEEEEFPKVAWYDHNGIVALALIETGRNVSTHEMCAIIRAYHYLVDLATGPDRSYTINRQDAERILRGGV